MPVVTRFAPSPTGYLHVGGLRTALYAYLFAKQHNGKFILRIEDTDQKRYVEGAVESLQNALRYFDLNWDEGPIFQSHRTEIYQKHAQELLANGKAYRCFCTPEELEKMREEQSKLKIAPKYDRRCYELPTEKVQEKMAAGVPFVVRQLIPYKDIDFVDLIRGDMHFHGKDIDDQVLIKSDGLPTYHLANVVDDHEMEITHVIRGEEWLPSTPKHLWLYEAFGWTPPQYAHLPLLLNPDRSKLSKRQGDVAAEDFVAKGYLKEAMINFIAFLGWNPGTEEEIFSMDDLVKRFSLDRVQKAGAVFNLEKLDWLNRHYLRAKTPEELEALLLPLLEKEEWYTPELLSALAPEQKKAILTSVQTRMKTLVDGPAMLKPFLLPELNYKRELFFSEKMKVDEQTVKLALKNALPALEALDNYTDEEAIKAALVTVIEKLGLKNGQVLWPLRVALTNEEYSPGVFELCRVMGKELTLKRLKAAAAFFQ
ncbi:glutamate--tRNA ligase [Candidatus Peregrinibacteria bacterium]|nr:MAG: glutamate--tRNA ligase [Candidatus Peregrinibacteria bacterium]